MGMYDRRGGQEYPPQRQGGGFGGRLLIAVIIALVGLFMYWSNVQENPVTGERQHVGMSPDQEIRLGIQSAPQMSREMGGEMSSSDIRTQTVTKMGEKLVNNSVAKNSPWQYKFHLLADSDTVNAFALPGGQIFITLGLYSKLENEAELAGVLAHEMGHVIERHSAQQMAKTQLGNFLVTAFGTAASDSYNSQQQAMMIAAMVNQMIQLRYSRHDESQADLWGVKLMEAVGYKPEAMIQVMEVLKQASGGEGRGPDFFQSHPNPDLRIEQIREYLKKNPPPASLSSGKRIPQ